MSTNGIEGRSRAADGRAVGQAAVGAGLLLAFVTLSRALREGLFLAWFDVSALPYLVLASAILGLPTIGLYVRLLSRSAPSDAFRVAVSVVLVGLCGLWPWLGGSRTARLVFFLWTALGALVLTTGFWSILAERFRMRDAKRAFALIAAGGTAGALATGLSLDWLTDHLTLTGLLGGLGVLLVALLLLPTLQQDVRRRAASAAENDVGLREGLAQIASHPYLRTIAAFVFLATIASTCVDYQFKDQASRAVTGSIELTAFFGAFYGYTGAITLGVQLLLARRVLESSRGIPIGLAALPATLLLGSFALFVWPSLIVAVAVRGADNALRRGLFRPLAELLYLPLPDGLRRRTKPIVDSSVDSAAEGFAALLIVAVVTGVGASSRWLSVPVGAAALTLLLLAYRIRREYVRTIALSLQDRDAALGDVARGRVFQRDLLSSTLTQLTAHSLAGSAAPDVDDASCASSVAALGDDDRYAAARERLQSAGDAAVPVLRTALLDHSTPLVVRRRVPAVLAAIAGAAASDALLAALLTEPFTVRYRAAVALGRWWRQEAAQPDDNGREGVWLAVNEELARLGAKSSLVKSSLVKGSLGKASADGAVPDAGARLEQVFRLMTLVLKPEVVLAAYHGVTLADHRMRDLALEYLEQSLPTAVRNRLWPVIGEAAPTPRPTQRRTADVVRDLLLTEATRPGELKDLDPPQFFGDE